MFTSNHKVKIGAATFISLGLLGDTDHDREDDTIENREENEENS